MPYTVVLVLAGLVLGELARHWAPLAPLQAVRLSPEVVFFLFLPALIFESGLNLNARQLTKDIAPVIALAVPALLFSTTVVGVGISFVLPAAIPLTTALIFGALISATDPVAVVAILREVGAPKRLGLLIEGESLLNDGTAIVVFGVLVGLLAGGTFDFGATALELVRVGQEGLGEGDLECAPSAFGGIANAVVVDQDLAHGA